MSDNYAAGVLLDPFVDDAQPDPPPAPDPQPETPPVEPPAAEDPPAQPEPAAAAPAVDFAEQLKKKEEELAEQRRIAEFWAKKATGAADTPPAPKPEAPAPKQLTKEEIADRLTEGDADVLKEMGYVRMEDVKRVAVEIADERIKTAETKYESGAELTKQYGDYLNPATDKYKAVAAEIQNNPTWSRIAQIDPDAALRGALEVVKTRLEAPTSATPPKIDYDKRIEQQAGARTKPTAANGVSTVATPSQKAAAETLGIPITEFMASVRELKGI